MSSSLLVLVLVATRSILFDVDWAAFRAAGDSGRLEVSYGVPHDQLVPIAADSGAELRFEVNIDVRALPGPDGGVPGFVQTGTIRKRAVLRSLREARAVGRVLVDQFSVAVPPGDYLLTVRVTDSSGCGSVTDTASVSGFGPGLAVSTLELGAEVLVDTATGSYAVVPNPGRRFGPSRDRAYVYLEVYNLVPDSGSWEVRCAVLPGGGTDTVVCSQPVVKRKVGSAGATALGVSLDGLATGDYTLVVGVTDRSSGLSVTRRVGFSVVAAPAGAEPSPFHLQLTDLERKYYRQLEYVATPAELGYYRALSDSGKEAYLAWYWQRHDLREFARRMEVAETRYRTARTAGVRTDRGRIYVKYGEPDAVEQRVHDVESKPREYWQYYRLGYRFIFIDLRGEGDYRLAFADSPDERGTGLEQYLTPEEQEGLR